MTNECKNVGLVLASSLLTLGILTAKCSIPSFAMPQTKNASNLFATIQVTSQSYCALDKPAGIAFFEVHVRIDNRSQTPAIISKKYLQIDPELDRVGPDGHSDGVVSSIIKDDFGFYDKNPPKNFNRDYIVIEPEKAHEMDSKVSTRIRTDRPQYNLGGGLVRPGNYLFGVVLSTWHASADAASEVRSRWLKKGRLYDGIIASNLVPVTIDPPPILSFCPGRDQHH
jgi:hypothetical protein